MIRKNNEILGLHLNDDTTEQPRETPNITTEKLSPREAGAKLRQETGEKLRQAVAHFGEVGRSLWQGLKRISREKWEGAKTGFQHTLEGTKSAAKQSATTGLDYAFYGAGQIGAAMKKASHGVETTASIVAGAPEWLLDKVGEGLYTGTEAAKIAGELAKEKAKAGMKYAGHKIEAGGQTVKAKTLAAAEASANKVKSGYDWTAGKMRDAGDWASQQYTEVQNFAGQQADVIKERAGQAKDRFIQKIEAAQVWYRNWQAAREKRLQMARLEALRQKREQLDQEIRQLQAVLTLDERLEQTQQAA